MSKVTVHDPILDIDWEIDSLGRGKITSGNLSDYKISDIDADASPNYYGFLRSDGAWYIIKETISAGNDTYRYASGSSGYNWSNRASETYQSFDNTF